MAYIACPAMRQGHHFHPQEQHLQMQWNPQRANKMISTVSTSGPTVQKFNLNMNFFLQINPIFSSLHNVSYTHNLLLQTNRGNKRKKINF